MTSKQRHVGDAPLRRFEYEDGNVLAADLGVASDASVDVLGDTVMVVAGDDHNEFEAPGVERAFIHNGVLTIELEEVSEA